MNTHSLNRFIEAQERTYQIALNEIKHGKKKSHWMWYIFPQLRGLGKSQESRFYGITGIEEAIAYLEHPILSERLIVICEALLEHRNKTAYEIFGDIDELKLKSSMTLFALTSENQTIFNRVLECFFDGQMDENTIRLLNK
jgi:uncharacterized protein (DUF1810 family)